MQHSLLGLVASFVVPVVPAGPAVPVVPAVLVVPAICEPVRAGHFAEPVPFAAIVTVVPEPTSLGVHLLLAG